MNRPLPSMHGGSLEITLIVPLKGFQIFLIHRKTFKYKDVYVLNQLNLEHKGT